jgi:hypothetical protein
VLPSPTVVEILQGTKALAGACFLAAHDPEASPEEVELLHATLEALHRQGTAFSRRLAAQAQLVPRPGPARR